MDLYLNRTFSMFENAPHLIAKVLGRPNELHVILKEVQQGDASSSRKVEGSLHIVVQPSVGGIGPTSRI
jgi:hypothetical protein